MVIRQFLASGGMWLNLEGTEILVDPGPGCIVQVNKLKLRPEKLSAIVLSHRHLDHSGDINVMAEAMTEGGFSPHGRLFLPSDALGNEPVIYSYLRHALDIQVLQEGRSYTVGNVTFTTPVRHIHPVETYGVVFKTGKHTFSYISDSRLFEGLCRSYGGELLIMNVVMLDHTYPVDHLSVADAEHIIKEIKPRVAILTHFGMTIWRARPWEVAAQLSEQTGVKVMAARDGMTFDLAKLDSVQV
ncbi:MAG: MBL fold metallo-hydrolase [Chloroflexi bacterium]|nr:MBL fold metallo-hydrolase [Chloroflexota bacterium]